jgi:hypothetical protein
MMRPDSIAREVFGDDFVDHFGATREHEVRLWNAAVTNWEGKCWQLSFTLFVDQALQLKDTLNLHKKLQDLYGRIYIPTTEFLDCDMHWRYLSLPAGIWYVSIIISPGALPIIIRHSACQRLDQVSVWRRRIVPSTFGQVKHSNTPSRPLYDRRAHNRLQMQYSVPRAGIMSLYFRICFPNDALIAPSSSSASSLLIREVICLAREILKLHIRDRPVYFLIEQRRLRHEIPVISLHARLFPLH